MLVNQLISRGAAGKVALIEKEGVYSYAQLQARTESFRDYLCPGNPGKGITSPFLPKTRLIL